MKFINNLFQALLVGLNNLGEIKKANYYGEDFATIEIENDDKIYAISMRSEEKTER